MCLSPRSCIEFILGAGSQNPRRPVGGPKVQNIQDLHKVNILPIRHFVFFKSSKSQKVYSFENFEGFLAIFTKNMKVPSSYKNFRPLFLPIIPIPNIYVPNSSLILCTSGSLISKQSGMSNINTSGKDPKSC